MDIGKVKEVVTVAKPVKMEPIVVTPTKVPASPLAEPVKV